jgi:hypothetical protein
MRDRYDLLRPSVSSDTPVQAHRTQLRLDALTLDADIQPREAMAPHVIAEYAALYRERHDLGAILVFFDGGVHWVADGFHRVCAAREAGLRQLPAEVRTGDKRNALLYACEANKHGKSRTTADKRRVILRLLTDPEWRQWSNGVIAQHCGVSREYVRQVKHQLTSSLPTVGSDQNQDRIYIDRWGNTATMDTSAIGHSTPPSTPLDTTAMPPDDMPPTPIAPAVPPVVASPALPSTKQLAYLQQLGDGGPPPLSMYEASQRIDALRRQPPRPPGVTEKYLVTVEPDGSEVVVTMGLDSLVRAWQIASPAAQRAFLQWANAQPIGASAPGNTSEQTQHYATEIARICGADAAPVS